MASTIISASRRTDIPAFYMPWFMAGIEKGFFEVQNPYNQRITTVAATPADVHSIVFWSKDYGEFLAHSYGEILNELGYCLSFGFTINSPHPILEPGIAPLPRRLDQLARLCDRFGPQTIQWRFDPICHFKDAAGRTDNNLDQFAFIAARAQALGIRKCITSFVDLYRKVNRRMAGLSHFTMVEPTLDQKVQIIIQMAAELSGKGIELTLCCEKQVLAALPERIGAGASACISAGHLIDLFGPGISDRQDPGQRKADGCHCSVSKDIGSYGWHPCRHHCLYCYANR